MLILFYFNFAWHRRSVIIESIVSDFQRGAKHSCIYNDSDSEDGAKIWKILEKASQPEVLLADMSPDQISSFAKYQANMEVGFGLHSLPN